MERDTTDHPDSIRSPDTATFLYYYLAGFGGSFLHTTVEWLNIRYRSSRTVCFGDYMDSPEG